ncbi:MAG: DUF1415 domain-containing protein [Thermoanaerobaculia bacterium]
MTTAEDIITATKLWLEKAIIGLNLCPFAKAVYVRDQIRYMVSEAETPEALLADLIAELRGLAAADPGAIDTTLIIHPRVLGDFLDYNDFLGVADAAVVDLGLEGVIQVASFHPKYQFAGSKPDDIENYTNRSPYPILHLLREASVERAVAAFPEASEIYEKNMATMRRLGHEGWRRLSAAPAPGPHQEDDAGNGQEGEGDRPARSGGPEIPGDHEPP